MDEKAKARWEKADVILKPVGGILTALAVALVGIIGSQILERRQAMDTEAQLYAQLMNQREGAETSLRKDMFNSIIGSFLKPKKAGYEEKVLNLELLVYNFHEALDLAPLFKSVYSQVSKSTNPDKSDYIRRLDEAADEVKNKQIAALEDSGGGGKLDALINFNKLKEHSEGLTLIDNTITLPTNKGAANEPLKTSFTVQALLVEPIKRRIRVTLEVKTPKNGTSTKDEIESTYATFWISPFDFPMIDNTRLPHGQRCAIVLRKWGANQPTAQMTLVYFPGSRASLKEKPFFDEAMSDLLSNRRRFDGDATK
jgi:hypothetical protein